jgi:hypothetical protein
MNVSEVPNRSVSVRSLARRLNSYNARRTASRLVRAPLAEDAKSLRPPTTTSVNIKIRDGNWAFDIAHCNF